jgi:cytoskeletal protein RodZ
MLKSTFLASSALAALLVCTACEQQTTPQSQQQVQEDAAAPSDTMAEAPNAAERAASEAANEVEQAAAPNAQITPAELASGVNGEDVANPEATLSTAAVKTSSGQALGEVRSVVVGPDGKADAVIVEVGGFLNVGERAVSIEANKFTYLKDRNILVASVAKTDVENMPAVEAQP